MKHTTDSGAGAALDFDTRLMGISLTVDVAMNLTAGPALKAAQTAVQRAREQGMFEPREYKPNPILKAAADLIRERGWARGEYEVNGRLCALGAIRTVTRGENWFCVLPVSDEEHDAMRELMYRVSREFGPATGIPKWNDSRSDVGEVLRLLY